MRLSEGVGDACSRRRVQDLLDVLVPVEVDDLVEDHLASRDDVGAEIFV